MPDDLDEFLSIVGTEATHTTAFRKCGRIRPTGVICVASLTDDPAEQSSTKCDVCDLYWSRCEAGCDGGVDGVCMCDRRSDGLSPRERAERFNKALHKL
jgi:hypothetical protein